METKIDINSQICTRCRRCVRVCPSKLFTQTAPGADVAVDASGCIVCGHCVAACESGAITHSDFPADKVHAIDYSQLPTPQQMMLLCKVRRSNRALSSKPVPDELLGQIIEAAHRAPTASNMQQIEFVVVTDPAKLEAFSGFTIDVFESILKLVTNPVVRPIVKRFVPSVYKYIPTFERLKSEYAMGNDMILRGAKAIVLIVAPSKSRFGIEDSNLAYQNASLMAECLGVSQIYMGFVLSAIRQKKGKLEATLGINGSIRAIMALGMPAFRYPNYIDKKEIVVTKI